MGTNDLVPHQEYKDLTVMNDMKAANAPFGLYTPLHGSIYSRQSHYKGVMELLETGPWSGTEHSTPLKQDMKKPVFKAPDHFFNVFV